MPTEYSLIYTITHFGAIGTLVLYIAILVGMLRSVVSDGLRFEGPKWLQPAHWAARAGVATLVLLGFFDEATRGGQFLWIACGLEIVGLTLVRTHPLFRLSVAAGVVVLLISSSVLAHLPVEVSGSSAPLFLAAHIVPAILAQAFLILCSVCGGIYIFQSYLIKQHRVEVLTSKLPSLQRLERWLHRSAFIGFVLMSLGLIIGSAGAASGGSLSLTWDWTQVSALLAWLVLGTLVMLRSVKGWSVKNNAYLAFLGVPLIFLISFTTLLYDGKMHHRSVEVHVDK